MNYALSTMYTASQGACLLKATYTLHLLCFLKFKYQRAINTTELKNTYMYISTPCVQACISVSRQLSTRTYYRPRRVTSCACPVYNRASEFADLGTLVVITIPTREKKLTFQLYKQVKTPSFSNKSTLMVLLLLLS